MSAAGTITRIRLAASFLTILPVGPRGPAGDASVADSYAYFPLVGFALGGALALIDRVLAPMLGGPVAAIMTLAILTLVTGALHLDALADTADALGAGGDRARALEIMRDSRAGTFGIVAIVFALALKLVTLTTASSPHRALLLYAAPAIARWAMVGLSCNMEYLRVAGAGSVILAGDASRNLRVASIITLLGLFFIASMRICFAAATAVAIVLGARWFYRRWLGGVTGDAIGAAGELVEVAMFVVLAR